MKAVFRKATLFGRNKSKKDRDDNQAVQRSPSVASSPTSSPNPQSGGHPWLGSGTAGTVVGFPEERQFSPSGSKAKNKAIEESLKQEERKRRNEVKLLLLGAGDSGKSTILKQMRVIHMGGFSPAERTKWIPLVFQNLVDAAKLVTEAMDSLQIRWEHPDNAEYNHLLSEHYDLVSEEPMPEEFLIPLKSMWKDAGFQECRIRGNEFALHDNMEYFFNDLDLLFEPSYVPREQDILRCRIKTTGISETVFQIKPLTYRVIDVGGQRSERRKWIHCFDDVTAVLFVVSISGYNQCLVEDRDSNQMREALMLFDQVINSKWFIETSMILFLNKMDLFQKKIKRVPIKRYFPEYKAEEGDVNQASEFFRRKFRKLNRSPNGDSRTIYIHFTTATETDLLKRVMLSVYDIIITRNVRVHVM